MKDAGRILIIGAGPCGLGTAHRLVELGYSDFLLLEARRAPGGLASSYLDDQGFTWDVGGHVGFSHYDYYDRVLARALPGGWLEHRREAWIKLEDRWIPYPFQNNLHRLPDGDREAALDGLEKARCESGRKPAREQNLTQWIDATFGKALAELFFRPYNFKVWGYPLEQLGAGWIGERVAVPDPAKIRRQIVENRDDVNWGPNRTFLFPRKGGTGAVWRAIAAKLPQERLHFNQRVSSIDLEEKALETRDGRRERFDVLVNTMPLDRMTRIAEGLTPQARALADRLIHSSVHILGLGIAGPLPSILHGRAWMYFPDERSPYYRVTVFSNYSPFNVPEGSENWSLLCEVVETSYRPVDGDRIEELVIEALRRDGLLPGKSRVISSWKHREAYGYPTPFLGRDQVLTPLQLELEGRSVYSRGRFGAWKYEVSNQDHTFMQGVELVDRLLCDGEEVTLRDPSLINSPSPIRGE